MKSMLHRQLTPYTFVLSLTYSFLQISHFFFQFVPFAVQRDSTTAKMHPQQFMHACPLGNEE
jgi:hypothetical protein